MVQSSFIKLAEPIFVIYYLLKKCILNITKYCVQYTEMGEIISSVVVFIKNMYISFKLNNLSNVLVNYCKLTLNYLHPF